MAKKYVVNLTDAERTELLEIVGKGRASARRLKRAHILLLADEGCTDEIIAKALHTTRPQWSARASGLWSVIWSTLWRIGLAVAGLGS